MKIGIVLKCLFFLCKDKSIPEDTFKDTWMWHSRFNIYGLLTKREVKMAGYWPISFFACLWTEKKSRFINTQKKNEANIQPF